MSRFVPVLAVIAAIIAVWYAAAVSMNIHGVLDQAQRDGEAVTPEAARDRRDVAAGVLVRAIRRRR